MLQFGYPLITKYTRSRPYVVIAKASNKGNQDADGKGPNIFIL